MFHDFYMNKLKTNFKIIVYIYFTVGGTYITVRGCAPFDSITFNRGMQRYYSYIT